MRLSDLLERAVVDQHGRNWGQVHDVYLVQDGPVSATAAAFRIHGLIAARAMGPQGTRASVAATRGVCPLD